jgi:hypothetical protein
MSEDERQVEALSLSDLQPSTVVFDLEMPYGKTMAVRMGMLTLHEWNEIGWEVRDPNVKDFKTHYNPVTKEKEPNPQDQEYQRLLTEAAEDRNYRRLVLAWEKGGNVIEGADAKEKVANLKKQGDAGILSALLLELQKAVFQGRARIRQRADSFHRNGSADSPDLRATPARADVVDDAE